VLLKPGERGQALALDPASLVVGRPFRLADLAWVLEHPPDPVPDPGPPAAIPLVRAAAPPVPAGPWGLPRPDWPAAATRLDGRRRRSRRGRRLAARVLAGALAALVLAGAWLALGLVEARRDLLVAGATVRERLTAAEAALERGGRPRPARPCRRPRTAWPPPTAWPTGASCGSRAACRCCRPGSATPGTCWRPRPA
jgi:hypothetical protein